MTKKKDESQKITRVKITAPEKKAVKVEVKDPGEAARIAVKLGGLPDGPIKMTLQEELSKAEKLSGSEQRFALSMIKRGIMEF